MAGTEMILWISIGLGLLILFVAAVTYIVTKVNSKEIDNVHNIYLGRLENNDFSIKDAMKYLKLTNGIKDRLHSNGEKQ